MTKRVSEQDLRAALAYAGSASKCRSILVGYEKKAAKYLGLIKVACVLIWYRRQHRSSLSG